MSKLTPKQKKDLLGIYKDYLYFSRGLEIVMHQNTTSGLSSMFIEEVGWTKDMIQPWNFDFTTKAEQDDYIKFVSGKTEDAKKYTYMSLYHTNKEEDAAYKKISAYPETYDYTNIDLNLPCLVERYTIAFPKDEKLKDATIIVDGTFRATYSGGKFADMPIAEAFYEPIIQKEFRAMLSFADYRNKHIDELSASDCAAAEVKERASMAKITADITVSGFENKVLDLLGSFADKAQEMLRQIYPDKKHKEVWFAAEKDNLISSAEQMIHYLNIRHLLRHQWDTLDNSTDNPNNLKDKIRNEYLDSYQLIFKKSITERIKEYQKAATHFQSILKNIYPELIAREHGETNSKLIARIKIWQKENPSRTPMINGNYPLYSDKHNSLVKNLTKIMPNAIILDELKQKDLDNYTDLEQSYFCREQYLRIYNQLESSFTLYCLTNGIDPQKHLFFQHLSETFFTPAEAKRWYQYRTLRNNLSHNHFSLELRNELNQILGGSFGDDLNNLRKLLFEHTPQLKHVKDNIFVAQKPDGSVVHIDIKHNKILSHTDKDGNDLLQKAPKIIPASRIKKALPVKLNYWGKDIIDCRFMNGITVDLNRKKICFPDGARMYFDAENYNVFQFDNGNKIFTDKTFAVTKYQERGRYAPLGRNEMFMASPKHKIKTDSRSRLIESSITGDDNQKLITKFYYGSKGAVITLADGTEIKTSATEFTVSHNNVKLTYDTAIDFIRSYKSSDPMTPPPFSR